MKIEIEKIELNKCLLTSSLIEHSAPKIFTFQTDESSLIQTKFYRSPLCVILSIENKQCQECKKIESKEVNSAKRKLETLKSPAKLNAPLSGTSTERIKLTLQGIRLENKTLCAELQQMQAEIAANSLHIGEEFSKDLKSIMSNSQHTSVYEVFLGGAAEISNLFENWCKISPSG